MDDTIIAIATPPGNGAIGIIRLSGKESLKIINKFINKKISGRWRNKAFFRKIIDEKKVIEHCIVTYYKAPHSYTGEDIIEISTHGNSILMKKIIEILLTHPKLKLAEPGEFTKRAFLNEKIDLTQAEAVADIISASSLNAAKLSMRHIEGDVKSYLKEIENSLLESASLLEIELDFSEEDIELVEKTKLIKMLGEIRTKILKTIEIYESKKYLREGIKVAIVGKPNVGKSSLLNAIIGKERAIVSSTPGTTRDYLTETIYYNGVNINFIDTAGLHESEDRIEIKGIEFSIERAEKSDLVIVVLDNSMEMDKKDISLFEQLKSKNINRILVVLNKSDIDKKIDNRDIKHLLDKSIKERAIEISAKTRHNITHIKEEIFTFFKNEFMDSESEIVISNERQYRTLKETEEKIELTIYNFERKVPIEMTAFDMREIINKIGEITGEITSDDILNNIFNSFCIGK